MQSVSGSYFSKINNYPNFKSEIVTLPEQKPDTVEISAQNKKKDGMSTGMKWLLGISGTGAAIYAALVGHRALSKPTLETLIKDFSEIFRRDVSKEEIPEMLKNYRNILKIDNEKEFCQKAFEQVKKDYGYKDLDLNLTLDESINGCLGGGWHTGTGQFIIFYKNMLEKMFDGKFNIEAKRSILSTIFHEFQHVKQTEYCVRTNLEEYLQVLAKEERVNKNFANVLNALLMDSSKIAQIAKQKGMTVSAVITQIHKELDILKTQGYKAIPEYVAQVNAETKMLRQKMENLFGRYEKFKPTDKEYEQGKKYIDCYGNYIEASFGDNTAYQNQLIEQEASHIQDLSKNDIRKSLRNIWNIFQN